ncbi:hypothetical protein SLOPH_2706, partial [Spraguea lophii 42_110]
MFFDVIITRNANFLRHIIKKHVKESSIIMTNCWKRYENLQNLNYRHFKISRSRNFLKSRNKEINTQTIEGKLALTKRLYKNKKFFTNETFIY